MGAITFDYLQRTTSIAACANQCNGCPVRYKYFNSGLTCTGAYLLKHVGLVARFVKSNTAQTDRKD